MLFLHEIYMKKEDDDQQVCTKMYVNKYMYEIKLVRSA